MVILAMFFSVPKCYRRVSYAGIMRFFWTWAGFWIFFQIWASLLPEQETWHIKAAQRLSLALRLTHCWVFTHSFYYTTCALTGAKTRSACPSPQGAYRWAILTLLPCTVRLLLVFFFLFLGVDNFIGLWLSFYMEFLNILQYLLRPFMLLFYLFPSLERLYILNHEYQMLLGKFHQSSVTVDCPTSAHSLLMWHTQVSLGTGLGRIPSSPRSTTSQWWFWVCVGIGLMTGMCLT